MEVKKKKKKKKNIYIYIYIYIQKKTTAENTLHRYNELDYFNYHSQVEHRHGTVSDPVALVSGAVSAV